MINRECANCFVSCFLFFDSRLLRALLNTLNSLLRQDVNLLHCTPDFCARHRILAVARSTLKQQGIVGLQQAVCLKGLLQKLPSIIQEQYAYEKVSSNMLIIFYVKKKKLIIVERNLNIAPATQNWTINYVFAICLTVTLSFVENILDSVMFWVALLHPS